MPNRIEDYRGISIWQSTKRKECHNPISGHRWSEDTPIDRFYVGDMGLGPVVPGSNDFPSVKACKSWIDSRLDKSPRGYSIANLKSMPAREGLATHCTLLRDGKRIGTYHDEGNGGMPHIDISKEEKDIMWQTMKATPGYTDMVTETEQHEAAGKGVCRDDTMAVFIGAICDAFETEKKLKRLSKKATLFRVKGDPEGDWRTVTPPGPKAIAWIHKNYGAQVESIYGAPEHGGIERSL